MTKIDELAYTKTTSQIIAYYRTNNLDIVEDMKNCTLGLRLALEQVLSKTAITIRHECPDRAEIVDKDIIDSLGGSD